MRVFFALSASVLRFEVNCSIFRYNFFLPSLLLSKAFKSEGERGRRPLKGRNLYASRSILSKILFQCRPNALLLASKLYIGKSVNIKKL